MDLGLQDKVAIVTGSSRRTWSCQRRRARREGYLVTICARGEKKLLESASELRRIAKSEERVLTVSANVASDEGVQQVITRTVEKLSAARHSCQQRGLARGATITDTSDAEWQEAVRSDLVFRPFERRASPLPDAAARRRGDHHDRFYLGSSRAVEMTYNAVKAAEISLAKSMAQQLAKDNIRVNSVDRIDFFSRWNVA